MRARHICALLATRLTGPGRLRRGVWSSEGSSLAVDALRRVGLARRAEGWAFKVVFVARFAPDGFELNASEVDGWVTAHPAHVVVTA